MIHYAVLLRRAERIAETLLNSQRQRECPFHQPHPALKSQRPGITEMSWSLSPPAKKREEKKNRGRVAVPFLDEPGMMWHTDETAELVLPGGAIL